MLLFKVISCTGVISLHSTSYFFFKFYKKVQFNTLSLQVFHDRFELRNLLKGVVEAADKYQCPLYRLCKRGGVSNVSNLQPSDAVIRNPTQLGCSDSGICHKLQDQYHVISLVALLFSFIENCDCCLSKINGEKLIALIKRPEEEGLNME